MLAALFFWETYNRGMKKVALETIGCRLNQYDTERIAAVLTASGFRRVDFDEPADLYIINTCTVTGRADASCRNIISRATRRAGSPPVVVVGCYVDSDPGMVARLHGVDLIVSNKEKGAIVSLLESKFPHLFEREPAAAQPPGIGEFHQHNRAWIKIGDGCNQRCAYCIIPAVRGPLVNRPAYDIIDEINVLSLNGYSEVVLTGIHIGRYYYDNIKSIAGLIRLILQETGIARIRLSSIEPQEVDEELIEAMIDGGRRVCRHLHIPLQSGSDKILKAMHRPYNTEDYMATVHRARESIGGIVIGADIIVGFPGETDGDFKASINAADTGLIDYLHVFSYSDRPGTDASKLPAKISPELIKKRNAVLREISGRHYTAALKREVGNIAYAISEHRSDKHDRFWGITDNYLKVMLPENTGGGKEILKLRIIAAAADYVEGIQEKNG